MIKMHKQENRIIEAAKRGFTLVELLIVVAILGILGAIGMQGVTGHIEKTRKTAAKTGVGSSADISSACASVGKPGYGPVLCNC